MTGTLNCRITVHVRHYQSTVWSGQKKASQGASGKLIMYSQSNEVTLSIAETKKQVTIIENNWRHAEAKVTMSWVGGPFKGDNVENRPIGTTCYKDPHVV